MIQHKLHQYTPRAVFGLEHLTPSAGAYWTVPALRRAVARWTGVVYQDQQSYQNLLHASGFSYQHMERRYRSRKASDVAAFSAQVEKTDGCIAQTAPETLVLAEFDFVNLCARFK